jgi:hypothetical protein
MWNVKRAEADDDAVDGGDSASLVVPFKRAVREMDFNSLFEQRLPQNARLLALRD